VPRSRFVQRLTFGPRNSISLMTIGPTDRHETLAGTYSRSGNILTLDVGSAASSTTLTIEVLSLAPDILQIRSNIPG
jgi:hypothetical protein